MFPSFNLFGKNVPMYGLMAITGAILAGVVVCRRYSRSGYDDTGAIVAMLISAPSAALCGSLLYGITNFRMLPELFGAADFSGFFSVFSKMFGGSVYYGGLFGGLTAAFVYAKARKMFFPPLFDSFAAGLPLFHSVARIGCFLGGCCFGRESRFGFTARGNPYVPQINGVRRFPVQLLESAGEIAIFFLINALFTEIGKNCRNGSKNPFFTFMRGKLTALYLFLYSLLRFFDEFLRGDDIRGFVFGGPLSTSQFISVLLFSGTVAYFTAAYAKRRVRKVSA